MFRVAPRFIAKILEEIFRHKVFKMLLSKGKITEDLIDMLMKWRHSGFNVFCSPKIQPGDENAMENLARYIVRASFSQERMTYVPEDAKVVYKPKEYKRNWAHLIQKAYETDSLCCPRCSGKTKVMSMIEEEDVIKKILKHLGFWKVEPRPPPKAIGLPKTVEHHIDYSVSQVSAFDKWLYVDPH